MKNAIALVVGLIVGGAAAWWGASHRASAQEPRFDVPFQAVLLDTGLVYFGKISGLNTPYPVLRDVYYIQSATNPETKQTSNILIRRGSEFHAPEYTVLEARHIVMVEPVGKNSKVAQLIAEQEKKK
ncbi:MAG TPA: hypothetical protein VMH80_14705 [Bryobacteraceae bacterium]|nr:hypothetical protein [Bryobacteraceae bacterium]